MAVCSLIMAGSRMREDYTSYLLKPSFNVNAQPFIASQSNMNKSFMSTVNVTYYIRF